MPCSNSARASIPEKCRVLVIWGSFVNYVPVFLVWLVFESHMFVCLEFGGAAWALVYYVFGSILRSSHVPAVGSLAYSVTHSTFVFSHSCR